MSSIALRIAAAEATLERLRNHANMADISPGRYPLDAMKIHVTAIEAAIEALAADLAPQKTNSPINSGSARHSSAVAAIAGWAREVGAAIVKNDSALSMIQKHCPESHRGFWASQHQNLIGGLVANEMKTSELLKAEGVLIFLADPSDGYIRIVDLAAPSAHADIYRRVTEWKGGRRCRYCRIEEPAMSLELQPVEAEQRNGHHTINGVMQMQPGIVHTHKQCRPFWLKWLQISGQYAGIAEAEAADIAAGRTSKPAPPPTDLQPDAPPASKPGWEPTRADQETRPIGNKVKVDDGRG